MREEEEEKEGETTRRRQINRRPWRNKVRKLAKKKSEQEPVKLNVEKRVKRLKKKKKKGEGEVKEMTDGELRLSAARFRYINEQLYTSTGQEAVELFRDDEDAFRVYHQGYQAQTRKWPRNPVDTIIQWLKSEPSGLIIADMGCGEAKIDEKLGKRHSVHSFDLVACNDRVTVCEMSKVPLESGSVDVVVFCLSLMGTCLAEYIREAHRILKTGGMMYIAEVSSRFFNVRDFLFALNRMGYRLDHERCLNDYFLLMKLSKMGKMTEKRPSGLRLRPCLYKKR